MTAFYKCEITGSVLNRVFSCYAEAYYNPNKNESKFNADLKVENKLIQYFDNNLSSTYGEISSINIINIKPEEYYGMKKSSNAIFI